MAKLQVDNPVNVEESTLTILRGMAEGDWYLISHNTYHHKVRPACILSYEKTDEYIAFTYRYFDDPQVHEYFTNWISDEDHGSNNDIEIKRTTREQVASHLMACVRFALSKGIQVSL